MQNFDGGNRSCLAQFLHLFERALRPAAILGAKERDASESISLREMYDAWT
jgi:hypothetical protein